MSPQPPHHVVDAPVFIAGKEGALAGIVSAPEGADARVGVIILSAGGHTVHAQSNRWGYRTARALAAEGFRVLRFDYHGIGDSAGVADNFALDEPNAADTRAAYDYLAPEVDVVVFIGHCFGARSAFEAALDIPNVAGIYAIAPPVRDGARGEGTGNRMAYDASVAGYLGHAVKAFDVRQLTDREGRRRYVRLAKTFVRARLQKIRRRLPGSKEDPTPWVSRALLDQLEWTIVEQIPVYFAYGTADSDYEDFAKARAGRLGSLLGKSRTVEVNVRDGEVHNMARVALQNEMIDEMVRWVLDRVGPRRGEDAS